MRPAIARKQKPKVSAFTSAKIDEILKLKPDFVVGFSDIQADIAAALIRHGVEVWISNHRSVAGILDYIRRLGALVGAADKANAYADALQRGLDAIEREATALPRRPKVYFEEWDEPPITGIRWVAELIRIAGGDDIFPERALEPLAKFMRRLEQNAGNLVMVTQLSIRARDDKHVDFDVDMTVSTYERAAKKPPAFVSLEAARANKALLDFRRLDAPRFVGRRRLENYPLAELLPLIALRSLWRNRRRTALAVAQLGSGQADQALGDLANIAASDSGTSADLALVSAHLRRNEFDKALKALEKTVRDTGATQLFIETPYRKVEAGRVTDEVEFYSALQEEGHFIAQANAPIGEDNYFVDERVLVRREVEELLDERTGVSGRYREHYFRSPAPPGLCLPQSAHRCRLAGRIVPENRLHGSRVSRRGCRRPGYLSHQRDDGTR